MKIAFIGASGTGKSTLARYVATMLDLPINPVGSRSTAADMGFVGPGGEGRPYDVDVACGPTYDEARNAGIDAGAAAGEALAAWAADEGAKHGPSCRPRFQRTLAEAKIAWEVRPMYGAIGLPPRTAFVTDRTPLDDLAYALLHCPSVVDAAFRDRAYKHTATYDALYYLPLSAGQWLDGDAARVSDPLYHWRYDVLLQGLTIDAGMYVEEVHTTDLAERKEHITLSLRRDRA